MKEILGDNLKQAFTDLNINATKTYQSKNNQLNDFNQVWELSDEDFNRLNSINDSEWKDNWGWWRSAKGSNMGYADIRYNINNHYIYAWDGISRFKERNYYCGRKYDTLLQYFCNELGASTERNVCALAVDLAKYNKITMSELFKKYQG